MIHSVSQCLYMFCQLFRYFKVQVLCLIQQPGSYWDSPSAYPVVGVRPTQMLNAMLLKSLSLCFMSLTFVLFLFIAVCPLHVRIGGHHWPVVGVFGPQPA